MDTVLLVELIRNIVDEDPNLGVFHMTDRGWRVIIDAAATGFADDVGHILEHLDG